MLDTEFIPARETGSRRLMVVLHGLGDSAAGYEWLPSALRIPWLNYLLVNAPDEYYGGYSWYDFAQRPGPGIARGRALLFELLEAQRKSGFPTEETFLFGFSQGCLMTLEVGLRYPHRLAGLIGVSGYVYEPERILKELSPSAREQKFLITHGHEDTLIALSPVREQIQMLKAAGLQIAWHEFNKGHTIIEEELALIQTFLNS